MFGPHSQVHCKTFRHSVKPTIWGNLRNADFDLGLRLFGHRFLTLVIKHTHNFSRLLTPIAEQLFAQDFSRIPIISGVRSDECAIHHHNRQRTRCVSFIKEPPLQHTKPEHTLQSGPDGAKLGCQVCFPGCIRTLLVSREREQYRESLSQRYGRCERGRPYTRQPLHPLD